MDKIADRIYLGDIRSAQDLHELTLNCITHIVTLSKSLVPMFPKHFNYLCVGVDDSNGNAAMTENVGRYFDSVN